MLSKLKQIDDKLIEMYVTDINQSNYVIPKRYASVFCRISGASELSYIFNNKFLDGITAAKALVVGLHGGRDYWASVAQGWDVHGMDLNEFDFPNTLTANAEERWPYDDQSFDVIIIGEVLEHLFFDKEALKEASRVLKPDGKLIVTVPFYDSNDEFHVRMHDHKTLDRLLNFSGFKVIDTVERPGLFFKSYLNYVNSVLAITLFAIFRINFYHRLVPFYGKLEYFLERKKYSEPYLSYFAILIMVAIFSLLNQTTALIISRLTKMNSSSDKNDYDPMQQCPSSLVRGLLKCQNIV